MSILHVSCNIVSWRTKSAALGFRKNSPAAIARITIRLAAIRIISDAPKAHTLVYFSLITAVIGSRTQWMLRVLCAIGFLCVKSFSVSFPLPIQVGQDCGVEFYTAPEVAQAEIFVGAVLMIVIIHDGDADPREAEVFENVHGDASA